ncbi:hypothetical protein C2869_01590 [Saccharobesus litoralis]|uniref:Uncharacterized protein n=1 Tax=Saccharobesus litoralis TaxID=2172099 RepID=A0A2S0VLZ5_9ALTE|nr:cyclic nucleotide-binding domain-containing protein [Saccharobesus litoralis]AWB65215.1 hypothetical protein C2869_01590 [Saccharobesus litoralis]
MPVKVQLATTTELIDKVFQLRHQVFVEEEGLLEPTEDKRIMDRYDAYPSTTQMIAIQDDTPVGCFRLSLDSQQGVPADNYFNFRPLLPADAVIMHTGLFCLLSDYRTNGLAMSLILMSAYFAHSNGVTHVVAPINPKIARLLSRIGFTQVADEFTDPHLNAQVRPMMLNMKDLNDFFLNFINKNQLHDFLMDYERWFYREGDTVVQGGTPGNEAFIIIEGQVEVRVPSTTYKIAQLGQGDMFGELALITDEVRSADIVATSEVQMMVMSKQVFIDRFINQPEHALKLMQLLGKRTQNLILQLRAKQAVVD